MTAEMCPRCGEPLPARANFCPNCGAPVAVPEASERRIVTVVFVDLAGSTELAAGLDLERLREVLAAFHGMVSEEIAWMGGVAEGFIGDAVLGVFGTPVARDDDAVRAIRAALAVRDQAERLGRPLGLAAPMQVRIGVNTGLVAVGTATDRNIVIGAQVNIGARLQQAAAPGQILAGPTTVQLAGTQVEFGEPVEVVGKGVGTGLLARPVVALHASAGDRSNIPMVDRRRELALLADTFDRVAVRGRAHLVTLLGEPGIGKSRVAEEFLARLPEGTKRMVGRSSPFDEEAAFAPLAQMIYREIGGDPSAPEEVTLDLLHAAAAAWVEPDEVERTARRLGLALGFGEAGSEENRYHAAEVRAGVLGMVTGLCAESPVVMVFEDLHSADPLLLDLLEQLMREARRLALLVVAVARWALLDDRPNWAGGLADAVTLWVEALEPAHAVRLAEESGDLGPADAERVAAHAGGNPLFIIEITGMLLGEERDVPPAGPGASEHLLPATVQAVVASRIDHLSAGARELVRRASVFPRGRFDVEELALIVEPRKELLAEAQEEELLVPDPDRADVWSFRSDVVRDVAYGSLAKRERQRLHLRVANRLSQPETAERYPRTIAFHLEQAALAALDLNPTDRALADRAVDALALAGDTARRRIESRAAGDLYERALALAGPEDAWGSREARIVSMLGEARYWLGEFEDAEELLRRALALADDHDDRVSTHAARFLADLTLTLREDDHLARALFERSLEAARRLGEPYALARTLVMAAWMPLQRGRLDEAEGLFREALATARGDDHRDPWSETRALTGLAAVTSQRGSEQDALAMAEEALGIAEDAEQGFSAATAHQVVAGSLRRLLRLDAAQAHADAAVEALRELGARWELASALGERGSILRVAGRLEESEGDLREALALCKDLRERSLIAWTAAELAHTLTARGDVPGAEAVLADQAVSAADGDAGIASVLLAAEAVVALAAKEPERARERAVAALSAERAFAVPNPVAAVTWWVGSLFGAEAAGGVAVVEKARDLLERNGWRQAVAEPELVARTG
ncbi:MAG: AAA family ATPase [Actinomycetota bacterium]